MHNYDQWTEIEDDAKKLHELVESQKNQINEIVTLISQTGNKNRFGNIYNHFFIASAPTSFHPTNVSLDDSEAAANNQQATSAANTNIISTLLKKIQDITGHHQEPASPPETILENHSPGTSPTQSLATLTLESLQQPIGNQTQQIEEPQDRQVHKQEPIRDQPFAPIDIPLTVTPQNEPKKCPVCSHEFASTSDDVDMYDHIEKCLFPTGINTEPKEYECPNCNRKYPGSDEATYIQHLTDCYNRDI